MNDLEESQLGIIHQWVLDEDDISIFTTNMNISLPRTLQPIIRPNLANLPSKGAIKAPCPTISEDFAMSKFLTQLDLVRLLFTNNSLSG